MIELQNLFVIGQIMTRMSDSGATQSITKSPVTRWRIFIVVASLFVVASCTSDPKNAVAPNDDGAAVAIDRATSAATGESAPTSANLDRKVNSMPEWLALVADCARERGWEVEVDFVEYSIGDDSVSVEQREAFGNDMHECETLAGRAPNDVDITEEWLSRYFDYLVLMKSCLSDLGFEISEPSSKADFIDGYLRGSDTWSPFSDLPDSLTQDELREIHVQCPENFT